MSGNINQDIHLSVSTKYCIVSDEESMKIWAPPFSSGGLLLIMERGGPFEIFSA